MRACLFCGGGPCTREDAWPLWLMGHFPVPETARMFAERDGRQLPDWPTTKARLVVKWLCGPWNNGWMSQLEADAKPIIEAILADKLSEIDGLAQMTLAQWAVKTVMVLEAFYPDREWFYSEKDRREMHAARTIPPYTDVLIAKCVNQPNIYSAEKGHRTGQPNDGVRAIATTMGFGCLGLQVVSVKLPATAPNYTKLTYEVSKHPLEEILVQVWPSSDQPRKWPPKCGLDGDWGLDVLTERLSMVTA
jgi:hypothetical protein